MNLDPALYQSAQPSGVTEPVMVRGIDRAPGLRGGIDGEAELEHPHGVGGGHLGRRAVE